MRLYLVGPSPYCPRMCLDKDARVREPGEGEQEALEKAASEMASDEELLKKAVTAISESK